MRRSISGWLAAAALLTLLTACSREEVKSDIELTSPATSAEMDKAFGSAVAEVSAADPNAVPRDPKAEDVAPVSFTTEPLPVPAN